MIDTHAHLTFSQFDTDRAAVLQRARDAGITAMINPGTDLAQSRAAVALAARERGVFAAVGAHPQDAASVTEEHLAACEALLAEPTVVAVGEVGLERTDRALDLAVQRRVLSWFVDRAHACGKPVVFHVRNAHADLRGFLDDCPIRPRGVVHCFSGTRADARDYLDRGLFLSVTGIVTFPNAEGLRDVVRDVPLNRLLLETDAPFLAPQSHRGERNEPAFVREVAEKIAEVKDVPLDAVEEVTDDNARRLFGLEVR